MTDLELPAWPWNSPPAAFVDRRAEQLAEQVRRGPLYLLIEPTFGEPAGISIDKEQVTANTWHVTRLRNDAWERKTYMVRGEHSRLPPVMSPYLVEMNGASDRLIHAGIGWSVTEQLFANANPGHGAFRIGGWLQMHTAPKVADAEPSAIHREGQALAGHLWALTAKEIAPGEYGALRLYDRRVLHMMRHIETVDWPTALRGIRMWAYLDHNLQLQYLEGPEGPLSMAFLQMGADPKGLLARTEAINLALQFMLERAFPLPDTLVDDLLVKVIEAERRGLADAKDQGAYAAEALLEPEFERWPKLDSMIQIAVRDNLPLHYFFKDYRSNWAGRPASHWAATTTKRPAP